MCHGTLKADVTTHFIGLWAPMGPNIRNVHFLFGSVHIQRLIKKMKCLPNFLDNVGTFIWKWGGENAALRPRESRNTLKIHIFYQPGLEKIQASKSLYLAGSLMNPVQGTVTARERLARGGSGRSPRRNWERRKGKGGFVWPKHVYVRQTFLRSWKIFRNIKNPKDNEMYAQSCSLFWKA